MNKEVQSIKNSLSRVLNGEPWYGRAVYEILDEVNPGHVFQKANGYDHSLIELLYHMITWADYCRAQLEQKESDLDALELLDWRTIDPVVHNWQKGVAEFKSVHDRIIALLDGLDDEFLSKKVGRRDHNFRFMLNGLIQHDIYHLGQIVVLKNLR